MDAFKVGDKFGDYTVVRRLGKGGMGEVWLLQSSSGREVAAKILDRESSEQRETRKRFLREAQMALGVQHPNLVSTYDIGEDPDTGLCYILMEYVSGGTLHDLIKRKGALPINQAVSIVRQIADVLELGRKKGIVHRDIKPANIMFDAEGTPKLADLGIALGRTAGVDTTVTRTGVIIGTPAYMSPEQMLDSHNVDTRADIYSLGVVFYEMLTGERPNKDDTIVQLMAKAVKGESLPDIRTLRPEISASLAQLLNMMVAPDKTARIASPAQLSDALKIIAKGGLLAPRRLNVRKPASPSESMVPQRKQLPWPVFAGAGAAIVISVAIGIFAFGSKPKRRAVPAVPVAPAVQSAQKPAAQPEPLVVKKQQPQPTVTPAPQPAVVEKKVKVEVPPSPPPEVVKETPKVTKPSVSSKPRDIGNGYYSIEVDGVSWTYRLDGDEAIVENDVRSPAERSRGVQAERKPAIDVNTVGQVTVPSAFDGHPVTTIGKEAFSLCKKVQKIVVPEGVTRICLQAFHGCWKLEDIQFPSTLRYIGGRAFWGCSQLKSIDIRNCAELEEEAFRLSEILEVKVAPDNPTYRTVNGLLLANSGTKLVFYPNDREVYDVPEGVTCIGPYATWKSKARVFKLPKSLRKLERCSMAGLERLTDIRLPDGVQEVSVAAFQYSMNLRRIVFPESLLRLNWEVASECMSVERLVFLGDAPQSLHNRPIGGPSSLQIVVRRGKRGWKADSAGRLPDVYAPGTSNRLRGIRYGLPEEFVVENNSNLFPSRITGYSFQENRSESPTSRVQSALDAMYPGWKTSEIGPGLKSYFEYYFLWIKHALFVRMPGKDKPVTFTNETTVAGKSPVLMLSLRVRKEMPCGMKVAVDGKVVRNTRLDGGDQDVFVDLSPWKGKRVNLAVTVNNLVGGVDGPVWRRIQFADDAGLVESARLQSRLDGNGK